MLKEIDLLAITLAVVSVASLPGCKHPGETAKAATASAANPLKVQVDTELLRQMVIGKPQVQEVTTQEKVAARVETDASRVARIGSPVDGRRSNRQSGRGNWCNPTSLGPQSCRSGRRRFCRPERRLPRLARSCAGWACRIIPSSNLKLRKS